MSYSYICTLTIIDDKNKEYSYSMEDCYEPEEFEEILDEKFKNSLEKMKNKIYKQNNVSDLCKLLVNNIESDRYEYYKDELKSPVDYKDDDKQIEIMKKLIRNIDKKKQNYIDEVTNSIKTLNNICSIKFSGHFEASGYDLELAPITIDDDNEEDFICGNESSILDFKKKTIRNNEQDNSN